MELLALLLAGLVETLVVLLVGTISAFVAILTTIADLLSTLFSGKASASSTGGDRITDTPLARTFRRLALGLQALSRKRWFRYTLRGTAVAGLAVCAAVAWLATYGLPTVARWSLALIENRAELQVEFEKVEGNLFKGHLRFEGLTVNSTPANPRQISGNCDWIDVRLRIRSLFHRSPVIDQFVLRDGQLSIYDPRPQSQQSADAPSTTRKIPRFVAYNLEITNVAVEFTAVGKEPAVLRLKQWEADRVRSRWFAFDILLRSHLEAELNDATIFVTSAAVDGGRDTEWQIENLPVTLAAQAIPALRMMREGTIDAHVTDSWRNWEERDEIVFDWQLTFRDVRAEVPPDASRMTAPLYAAAAEYFNVEPERSFRLSLTMTPDEFDGAASLDATDLFGKLSRALMDQITDRMGVSQEVQATLLDAATEAASRYLDRRRRPVAEEEPAPLP